SRSISDVSGTTQQESILLRLRPSGQIHRLIQGHQRLGGLLGGCTPATPSCGSVATASTTVCATLLAGVRDRTRIRARISGGGLHRRTRNRALNGAAVGGIVPSHRLSQLGSRQLGEFRSRLSSATCPACDRVERPPDSCQG